jgi:transcriptional regulator with XRE-family HTH domain
MWHRLGAELRSRREDLGLSQAQLGELVRCSGALVGKIELGERRASLDTIERADTALRAGGLLTELWHSATEHDSTGAAAAAPEARDLSDPDRVGELIAASLRWVPELTAAVDVTRAMWRAEAADRKALASTAWEPSAYATPLHTTTAATATDVTDAAPDVPIVLGRDSGRVVGQADVEGLWQMSAAFTDFDHRLGGGYARSTLIHFLEAVVRPILDGRYTDQIGRGLLAAAARLCNLAAFMSFDSGEQGLAQRYFLQSLRLAHASCYHALTGHILGDMSMQAHHLGEPRWALDLADAGFAHARRGGSPATAARCAVLQGRAHALQGDPTSAARARLRAEQTLDRSYEEPSWIRFFTPAQLTVEAQYIAAELGQRDEVKRLAHHVDIVSATGVGTADMQRRRVLSAATLAGAYLPSPSRQAAGSGGDEVDVDHAAQLLAEVMPAMTALTSTRAHARVQQVRRDLAPYRDRASVQDLEALHQTLTARTAPTPTAGGPTTP